MKKIAIAGTHGVGKTTLAYSLANYYKDRGVALSTHIARSLIGKGYPLGKDATTESYIQYIIAQLTAEQETANSDLFVSDRTLLDPLSYAIVNLTTLNSAVPPSIVEMIKRIWILELCQYDLYIFVPIEFPMYKDGVRPDGEEYRALVEKQIEQLLDEYHVRYIRVSGSPEDRNTQAVKAIDELLGGRSKPG